MKKKIRKNILKNYENFQQSAIVIDKKSLPSSTTRALPGIEGFDPTK